MKKPRDLDTGEHHIIGNIIGDGFSDDPVNSWVFGNQKGIQNYFTSVAKKLYLRRGYGHVMDDGSGGSLWLPPNVEKHIPILNSLDIAATMIRYGGVKSLHRGLAVDHALAQVKPSVPHYYLFAIACRSTQRGKGIGGALMETGLERADMDKQAGYLESSKESNVSFYRRYGFEVLKKITPKKDGPPLWTMWRDPR